MKSQKIQKFGNLENVTLHVVSYFPGLEVFAPFMWNSKMKQNLLCVFFPIPRWTSLNKYHFKKYHLGYLF